MFEKEAEEYAFDEVKHKQEWYIKHPERSIDEDYEDIKKHWGKGAEFGYNKANEWHYVKDGDLPKENKLYFVAIKDNGLAIAYFNGLHWETRYNLGDFGHCVETVIAWKEIILPKEIE
jgi:hypothetical protein